jgi:rod shape-determining protein MreD
VRTFVLMSLFTLAALLLQTTVVPLLPFAAAMPDLLLVVCVYLGLQFHSPLGALGAFSIGYVQDAFSGGVPGLNAFAMTVVFVAVYLASRRLWVTNTFSRIVMIFLASLVKAAAVVLLLGLFLSVEGVWSAAVRYVVLEAMLAAALGPLVFALLARMHPVSVEHRA